MKNSKNENSCDCPLECNAIKYSYYYVSSPLDPVKLCPSSKGSEDFLMKDFYENPMPPMLLKRMEMFVYNSSDKMSISCKKNVPYNAEVTFRLATNTMTVTVTSRRLSFFDKLSGFGTGIQNISIFFKLLISGGILGLFTGMSILSMVEIVFWMFRYLVSSCRIEKK